MRLFDFTKYFFDIFSKEKDYLVFFISVLRIGKIFNSYIQIHSARSYTPGKYAPGYSLKAKLKLIDEQLNQIRFREGVVDFEKESVRINLTTSSCNLDLKYINSHFGSDTVDPFVIRTYKNGSLSWTPLQIKGLVNGKISLGGKQLNFFNASGYIDEVKTSVLPVRLHLRKLLWGRLHHEKADMTYSLMIDENSTSVSMMILYYNSMNIEFTNIQYRFSGEKMNKN